MKRKSVELSGAIREKTKTRVKSIKAIRATKASKATKTIKAIKAVKAVKATKAIKPVEATKGIKGKRERPIMQGIAIPPIPKSPNMSPAKKRGKGIRTIKL